METSTVLFQLTSNHLFLQVPIEKISNQVVELSRGLVAANDEKISVNIDITAQSIRLCLIMV